MENWRAMTIHSFGFQVQCGGCEAWVTNVSAEDVAAAHAGKGRCHDCLVKSPHIVEVTVPPEEPVDAPEETVADLKAEETTVEVGVDPGAPEEVPAKVPRLKEK